MQNKHRSTSDSDIHTK